MSDQEWQASDFVRRAYYIDDEPGTKGTLEGAKRLEVVFLIDGKRYAQLQLREPGMLAIVSKPDETGIWLERIEYGKVRYTDRMSKDDVEVQQLRPWQIEILGLK